VQWPASGHARRTRRGGTWGTMEENTRGGRRRNWCRCQDTVEDGCLPGRRGGECWGGGGVGAQASCAWTGRPLWQQRLRGHGRAGGGEAWARSGGARVRVDLEAQCGRGGGGLARTAGG
jgi:hypothetical protein